MSRALSTLSGPLHEFGASLCWNLAFKKSKKPWRFRLKFFKSTRRKNGMVLKGHPRGRLSSQRSGVPVEALPLPFFFWVGVGGGGVSNPGWAQGVPLRPCIGGEQRFWKRPSVVASPRCYPTRCMGLRMFVTNALQNRPRPDRSRRTARGTLAS